MIVDTIVALTICALVGLGGLCLYLEGDWK